MADAVNLALINSRGEVLLQLRDKNTLKNPNCWGLFGGAIEPGESLEAALYREATEELGYKVRSATLVFAETAFDGKKYVFLESIDMSQELRLFEGSEMRWVSASDIKNIHIAPNHISRIMKLFEFLNKNPRRTAGV